VTFARGLSRVLAGLNGLLLLLVVADANDYLSGHTSGERAVALAVGLLLGGLTAGLVGGKATSEVPAPGLRWGLTAVACAAPVVSFLLLCAGGVLLALLFAST